MYALAWHENGTTFLVLYGSYEEAHSNLAKAIEVDPTAKIAYPNGMPEDRIEDDLIDLGWDGRADIPF